MIGWFISAVVVLAASAVFPAHILVTGFWTAFGVAILLGFLNFIIWALFWFIALPLSIATLGVFALVINALAIMLVDSMVQGFSLSGFGVAFLLAAALSFVKMVFRS